MIDLKSTHIPTGDYVSNSDVADFLGIGPTSLYYHIRKGHLKTVRCPTGCHMFLKDDVLEFALNRRHSRGHPPAYKKYCERCDKLGFDKCECKE
jgi:hypothetical protein